MVSVEKYFDAWKHAEPTPLINCHTYHKWLILLGAFRTWNLSPGPGPPALSAALVKKARDELEVPCVYHFVAKQWLEWREGYVTNFSLENNLPTFQQNVPVVIRGKVKRCQQTLLFIDMHYWGYMSLEVKGWRGLLLPPCLLITVAQQPGTSSPPSRLKRSSESVIWMCSASFTNGCCLLPESSTMFSIIWPT